MEEGKKNGGYADVWVSLLADEELNEEQRDQLETSARHLYGLIHARFIITSRGLAKMVRFFLISLSPPLFHDDGCVFLNRLRNIRKEILVDVLVYSVTLKLSSPSDYPTSRIKKPSNSIALDVKIFTHRNHLVTLPSMELTLVQRLPICCLWCIRE